MLVSVVTGFVPVSLDVLAAACFFAQSAMGAQTQRDGSSREERSARKQWVFVARKHFSCVVPVVKKRGVVDRPCRRGDALQCSQLRPAAAAASVEMSAAQASEGRAGLNLTFWQRRVEGSAAGRNARRRGSSGGASGGLEAEEVGMRVDASARIGWRRTGSNQQASDSAGEGGSDSICAAGASERTRDEEQRCRPSGCCSRTGALSAAVKPSINNAPAPSGRLSQRSPPPAPRRPEVSMQSTSSSAAARSRRADVGGQLGVAWVWTSEQMGERCD